MQKTKRYRILETPVDAVNMEGALAFVDEYIAKAGSPGVILAANPEKVYALRKTPFSRSFSKRPPFLSPMASGSSMP